MTVMDPQAMREEKMNQLRLGHTVYAESPEFIRMMKRGIEKANLQVEYEDGNGGCWFIPVKENDD
jgi:hypothetical protein